jgi:hypothetical protein
VAVLTRLAEELGESGGLCAAEHHLGTTRGAVHRWNRRWTLRNYHYGLSRGPTTHNLCRYCKNRPGGRIREATVRRRRVDGVRPTGRQHPAPRREGARSPRRPVTSR